MNGNLYGECEYRYPDPNYRLIGEWNEDGMKSAIFKFVYETKHDTCYEKTGNQIENKLKGVKIGLDATTKTHLSQLPLIPDPYECAIVYVKPSPIADEGLFAKVKIYSKTVVSFYNGLRVNVTEVDRRPWELNNNTISLDDEIIIDIPIKYNDTNVYCASLGHKANHSFTPNAKYDIFPNHPRFGNIKCIRAIRDIAADEEIVVDYGYKPNIGPKWYRDIIKKRKGIEK